MRLFGLGREAAGALQRPLRDDASTRTWRTPCGGRSPAPRPHPEVVVELRGRWRSQRVRDARGGDGALGEVLRGMVFARLPDRRGSLNIILVLGVNGVGKTTTIAKLAHHYHAVVGSRR